VALHTSGFATLLGHTPDESDRPLRRETGRSILAHQWARSGHMPTFEIAGPNGGNNWLRSLVAPRPTGAADPLPPFEVQDCQSQSCR
jgi:hypothetical protein